jgi:hypothetical protein
VSAARTSSIGVWSAAAWATASVSVCGLLADLDEGHHFRAR